MCITKCMLKTVVSQLCSTELLFYDWFWYTFPPKPGTLLVLLCATATITTTTTTSYKCESSNVTRNILFSLNISPIFLKLFSRRGTRNTKPRHCWKRLAEMLNVACREKKSFGFDGGSGSVL